MTDSLKLAEMQRTSIEFERQRHLANWFIKSSQHMATPPSLNPNGSSQNVNNKGQKSNGNSSSGNCGNNKNGTMTTANPLFFIVSGQKSQPSSSSQNNNGNGNNGGGINGNGSLALSRSQIFTSQTNLPLQIVTSSGQDGHKPKLRRFNSHDTSANMFSVADFENARLARRNEIEMKQRLQQRLKMNSLSSGGDCSTGDSKGSKYSNDSQPEPLSADVFLDRYSLPRVVRISHKPKFSHETLQSSSSNGSSSTNSSTSLANNNNNTNNNNNKTNNDHLSKHQNGELYLLYRHLRQRKIYHGFNTKSGAGSRKKGVMIPQEFPGYFSLINEKGSPIATMYTALVQLVRERVYKFISVDNLPAFTESQSTDTFPPRSHYVKSTARGGQIFRLLAVFEDGKQQQHEQNSSSILSNKNVQNSGREKEKGRYAQLLSENRQILYVSLTAKGKFYEIEPGIPQILQKSNTNNDSQKKINPDCVHRISNLITINTELPIMIKYISGPTGTVNIIPENLTITKITEENIIIACPIEDVESRSPLHLRKLYITPDMILTKCFLGFENEQRMLANQNVQNILKFCQFNCDTFLKLIELELINRPERNCSRSKVDGGLKILKPLNFPKLLRREKSTIAHEKEDSIIFLSKNDLANLEQSDDVVIGNNGGGGLSSSGGSGCGTITSKDDIKTIPQNSSTATRISDKMKVFQTNKKKWFRRNDKQTSLTNLDIDLQQQTKKRMSMERYNDMSKLLQERFGDALTIIPDPTITNVTKHSATIINNERPLSELGGICSSSSLPKKSLKTNIQKSLSLQDVDFIDKPDLLSINFHDTTNYDYNNYDSHLNLDKSQQQTIDNVQQHQQQQQQQQQQHQKYQLQPQQSFISEKMYSEFHVKTKQYSKSSSSLHQLLHFGGGVVSQQQQRNNENLISTKKSSSILKFKQDKTNSTMKKFDLNFIETINDNNHDDREKYSSSISTIDTNTIIDDDLPYSSVRDSLITNDLSTNDDENNSIFDNNSIIINDNNQKLINNDNQYLNGERGCGGGSSNHHHHRNNDDGYDDTKENIYAEICHDSGAISRVQINVTTNSFMNSNNSNTSSTTITTAGGTTPTSGTSGICITTNCTSFNDDEQKSQNDGASTDNIYNTLK